LDNQEHAEAAIAPGTLVDNFKVARLIGRGGFPPKRRAEAQE
jgi:hypothetical protein